MFSLFCGHLSFLHLRIYGIHQIWKIFSHLSSNFFPPPLPHFSSWDSQFHMPGIVPWVIESLFHFLPVSHGGLFLFSTILFTAFSNLLLMHLNVQLRFKTTEISGVLLLRNFLLCISVPHIPPSLAPKLPSVPSRLLKTVVFLWGPPPAPQAGKWLRAESQVTVGLARLASLSNHSPGLPVAQRLTTIVSNILPSFLVAPFSPHYPPWPEMGIDLPQI